MGAIPKCQPSIHVLLPFPKGRRRKDSQKGVHRKKRRHSPSLVGVSYTALGFNSDARNTSFRYNISTNSIEASSKDAGAIDRIGISASLLPRAKGTEGERMSMEADSIYSSASEKDILISLEENDRGDTCKITLSPKRRFCTYRLKIMNIDNQQNLSSSIAGSISDLAGGINFPLEKRQRQRSPFHLRLAQQTKALWKDSFDAMGTAHQRMPPTIWLYIPC